MHKAVAYICASICFGLFSFFSSFLWLVGLLSKYSAVLNGCVHVRVCACACTRFQ